MSDPSEQTTGAVLASEQDRKIRDSIEDLLDEFDLVRDTRIDRIRAVLSDPMLDEAMMLDQVNAIIDDVPLAVGGEPLEPLVSTATTARRRVVHITQTLAPRVFFPGDTVPGGAWVVSIWGARFMYASDWPVTVTGPLVETSRGVSLPPKQWQAVVDRARAEREES